LSLIDNLIDLPAKNGSFTVKVPYFHFPAADGTDASGDGEAKDLRAGEGGFALRFCQLNPHIWRSVLAKGRFLAKRSFADP
jgi:hypothetical protein